MNWTLLIGAIIWIFCGLLAWSAALADFWYQFPILQSQARWRKLLWREGISNIPAGPLALLMIPFLTAGFRHGFLFHRPVAGGRLPAPTGQKIGE